MQKHQSGQSANASRATRRPLTEFTQPSPDGDAARPQWTVPSSPPSHTSLTTWREDWLDKKRRAKVVARWQPPRLPVATDAPTAAITAPRVDAAARTAADSDNLLDAVKGVSAVAEQAAKDFRGWMFERMRTNVAATIGFASIFAGMSLPLDPEAAPKEEPRRKADDRADRSVEESEPPNLSAPVTVAAEFCTKALEFTAANVNVALDYAQRLGELTSAAEFVEVSTGHARRQFDLMMQQSAQLGNLSQSLVSTNTEWISARIGQTLTDKD